jgi:hypothetical protein
VPEKFAGARVFLKDIVGIVAIKATIRSKLNFNFFI